MITADTEYLYDIQGNLHGIVNDRSIKDRITKLKKKMFSAPSDAILSEDDYTTDSSQNQSIRARKNELQDNIKNVDIFICVESWLDNEPDCIDDRRIPTFLGYKCLRKDRLYATGGGIFVLIREHLAFRENIDPYPKRKSHNLEIKRNPVAWWDEECNRMKRLRRASYKRWQHCETLDNLIKYKDACALANKTFNKKKIENFKIFAGSINHNTSMRYDWDKCRIFKSKWVELSSFYCSQNLQQTVKIQNEMYKIAPLGFLLTPVGSSLSS
ncbi:hypothetical protein HHI36_019695 [Cryptolaemus montrouzieri]|uniref:Uncharacterized protein n=1 Tax=Cryptolaemus montrouzieri TaxID=559131 RepID=A0ABD2N8K0_9CUCU